MRCFAEHPIVFPYELNKLNNTGTRMQDPIYHMTLKTYLIGECFALKRRDFGFKKHDVLKDANA